MERFEITDSAGAPQFEARGHLGSQITLHDASGREVAVIRKHLMTDTHELFIGGQRVAQVRHAGIFGDKYDIESAYGVLSARGHFAGGDYTIGRGGMTVARVVRKFSLREKFAIEIADNEDQVFGLSVVLAIEAIHAEREHQEHHDGGFGMGGGGILGGNFP